MKDQELHGRKLTEVRLSLETGLYKFSALMILTMICNRIVSVADYIRGEFQQIQYIVIELF